MTARDMGFFARLITKMIGGPRAAQFDLTNMSPEDVREFLRIGGSHMTASGAAITENSALRVAAAWRCVQIIAGAVSTLPLDLIRREDEDTRLPAVGHPLRQVLTVRPNNWQTPKEFKHLMQMHLLLRGNAYARKVMSGGQVVGLIPLHPDRVRVEQTAALELVYHVQLRDHRMVTLAQADMLHLRGMSLDGVTGLSVLSYMREALGVSLQAERAAARLYRQGVLAGGSFTHPNTLSDEAYNRLRESLEERYSGEENAHKFLILEEGLTPERLGLSALDAQFLETRDFQRFDVAMFFGVPPHMIGATDKTTSWGSGIEQQNIGFVTYTLGDWLKTWEEAIRRDLISEREAERLDARFFVAGLLRGDVKTRWDAYVRAMQYGVYSPDEVRRFEDENPRPDGGGGVYYEPPNTAGGGRQGESDEPDE